MEGLNTEIDHNEDSHFGYVSHKGTQEETVQQLLPSDSTTFKTAAPTLLREIAGSGYIMAHHNSTRWQIICEKLQPIAEGDATFEDVVETISFFANDQQFQSRYRRKQTAPAVFMLDEFFKKLDEQERIAYQTTFLPRLAQLILETETLFPNDKRISIFTQDENRIGSLSKRQCACIIAHMVFCITVDQPEDFMLAELIDFSVIYTKPGLIKNTARKIHKIKCIFTYLERILNENPQGNVIFERVFLQGTHNEDTWADCDETITSAEIIVKGSIEDTKDALQVVFSDKELGDQVLQLPTTQQQIMSLIHPELLLTILLFEKLQKEETVRVYGAGRYSNYKGYGDSFEFVEAYKEEKHEIERQHVIMDAEKYTSKQGASQFAASWVLREINKAYSGFIQEEDKGRKVATGKWGCGVFKGNPQLKFIIQWLAASRAYRDIVFYSYGDETSFNNEETQKILKHYTGKEVGELFKDLIKAARNMQIDSDTGDENKNLFRVLIAQNEL